MQVTKESVISSNRQRNLIEEIFLRNRCRQCSIIMFAFLSEFIEIKVELSKDRLVLIPYSIIGRLKWSDMTSTAGAGPDAASMDDYAEWAIPIQ